MTSTPLSFPSPPPGFYRVGWHGMTFLLPDDWNLRLHHGDTRNGALIFADLRSPRVEIRWQSPRALRLFRRNPGRVLEKTVNLLQRRHPEATVEPLSDNAVRINRTQGTLLLAADANRLYELHWPPATPAAPETIDLITRDFLDALPLVAGRPDRFWSIYGATGWVPAAARLQKVSLLPGATTLSFRHRRTAITLGAFSMADRLLLKAGSLRDWAASAIPLVARHPAGQWQESPDSARFTAEFRRPWRIARHTLDLRHDRPANRILWTHHFGPVPR